MENVFLFIIIGFIIFLISRFLKDTFQSYRFFIYTVTGFISGAIIGNLSKSAMPYPLSLSWTISAFAGWLTGILLYFSEKFKLFSRAGIEYIATLFIGSIEAIILWGMFKIRAIVAPDSALINGTQGVQLLLLCMIAGFVSVFGYALPYRWFIRKKRQS